MHPICSSSIPKIMEARDLSFSANRTIDDIGFYTLSERRAEKTAELYHRQDPLAFGIERAEVVLGSECNLKCTFCKSLPSSGKSRFSLENLDRILQEWLPGGAKYVHITGGEPTLQPNLRQLVEHATKSRAIACMTSNGTAPFPLYQDLIELGLRDIRISLHAHNSRLHELITETQDTFENIINNIQRLIRLRDQFFPHLYVMINACIVEGTLKELPELLRFLMAFNPNDIKPVVIVQLRGHKLEEMREYYEREILPELMEMVPQDRFPILRYRLPTLLTSHLRGFPGKGPDMIVEATPHCFLMLDDRCIDSEWYYPCNIYLREGGAPLGSHCEDDLKTAAERIWDFVQNHDVREDPICRSCCPDVVREYNLYVADLLSGAKMRGSVKRRLIC